MELWETRDLSKEFWMDSETQFKIFSNPVMWWLYRVWSGIKALLFVIVIFVRHPCMVLGLILENDRSNRDQRNKNKV